MFNLTSFLIFDTLSEDAPLFSGYNNITMPNNASGKGQAVINGSLKMNWINRDTWEEWTVVGDVVKDSSGVHIHERKCTDNRISNSFWSHLLSMVFLYEVESNTVTCKLS